MFSAVLITACSDDGGGAVDCSVSDLSVEQVSISEENCSQGGSVEYQAVGGDAPYDYSISAISFKASGLFQNLSAGSYTLTVRDDNNCMINESFTIGSEVPSFTMSAEVSQDAGCGGDAGIVEVVVSGGSGSYSYEIDGSDMGTSSTLTNVPYGNHVLTAIDEVSCSDELDIYVSSGISYSASVASIIENNCAIDGCHVSGNSIPDFSSFATIQSNADKIKELTQNKSMPRNGSLTQAEIDAIACWVDDGALDN